MEINRMREKEGKGKKRIRKCDDEKDGVLKIAWQQPCAPSR